MEQHVSQNTEPLEDDIFDEWIETGTIRTTTVTIQADQAVISEFEELDKKRADVEAAIKAGTADQSLSAPDPLAEIEAQERALLERWEAGKALWSFRALEPDEVDEIAFQFPDPPAPVPPKDTHEKAQARFERAHQEWLKECAKTTETRNAHLIAKALLSIETSRGTKTSITVEQLLKMKHRPYGAQRFGSLYSAVLKVSRSQEEMSRPKSRELSTPDQD